MMQEIEQFVQNWAVQKKIASSTILKPNLYFLKKNVNFSTNDAGERADQEGSVRPRPLLPLLPAALKQRKRKETYNIST